jgi:hypothetical protein
MITTSRPHFVNRNTQGLYSNGESDTLDSINENALGVRANSQCYDENARSSHHSKPESLTQGFAMSQEKISPVNHSFNVEYASMFGINCSMMIGHFIYWIEWNQRMGVNEFEGKTWFYQTQKEMSAHFPYWSEDIIYKIIKRLEDLEIIEKGNFNKHKYDRTNWYCFKNQDNFIKKKSLPSNDGKPSVKRREASRQKTEPIPHSETHSKIHTKNNNNSEPPVVVVVQIENEEEKKRLIEEFKFDDKAIEELLKNPLENFTDAILAMKEKQGKIDNPKGYIRNAINNGWKPEGKKNRFDLHTPSSKKEIEEDNEKFKVNLFVRNENKRNAELCIKYCLNNPNCKEIKEKIKIYPSTTFDHLDIGGKKIDFDMKNSEFMQRIIDCLTILGYPISEKMTENVKYYQGKNI